MGRLNFNLVVDLTFFTAKGCDQTVLIQAGVIIQQLLQIAVVIGVIAARDVLLGGETTQ